MISLFVYNNIWDHYSDYIRENMLKLKRKKKKHDKSNGE